MSTKVKSESKDVRKSLSKAFLLSGHIPIRAREVLLLLLIMGYKRTIRLYPVCVHITIEPLYARLVSKLLFRIRNFHNELGYSFIDDPIEKSSATGYLSPPNIGGMMITNKPPYPYYGDYEPLYNSLKKTGPRYNMAGLMLPEPTIQGSESFYATHKALGINEILEHILSFINPPSLNCNTGPILYQSCEDSDGFWDIIVACRQVNKRWRDLIDNSPMLRRDMWLPKGYKVPKAGDRLGILVSGSDLQEQVESLRIGKARPRIDLCYPLFSWLTRILHDMEPTMEENNGKPEKGLAENERGSLYAIDLKEARHQFIAGNFPQIFFTSPPVADAMIHFHTNHPTMWDLQVPPGCIFANVDRKMHPRTLLRAIRCGSPNFDDGGPNGVMISNKAGVTASDIMFAFDEYIKFASNPGRSWNKNRHDQWELLKFSIGIVTLCREDDTSGIIGYCELAGEIDVTDREERFKIINTPFQASTTRS